MLTKKQVAIVKQLLVDITNFKKFQKELNLKHSDIYQHFHALNTEGRGLRKVQVYNELYPDIKGQCLSCDAATIFGANNIFGYAKFCSTKCSNQYNSSNGIFKAAVKKKYGVDNVSQLKDIKKKKAETCMKNYGVKWPQQSKEVRKITVASNMKNYGVANVSNVPSIQRKREKTMTKLYGHANVMHNPDMLEYTMHRAHRVKRMTLKGKTFQYMGYEGRFIKYLVNTVGVDVKDITTRAKHMPEIFYKVGDKEKKYTPDVSFKHKGKTWVVEVKSIYTCGLLASNRQQFSIFRKKIRAAAKVCNFAAVILPEKGKQMKIYKDFTRFKRSEIVADVTASFSR